MTAADQFGIGWREKGQNVFLRVPSRIFEARLQLMRESGAPELLEQVLRPATHESSRSTAGRTVNRPAEFGKATHRTGLGRPRLLPVDVFLTAQAFAISGGRADLVTVHSLLTHGLPRSYQAALGIRIEAANPANDEVVTLDNVRYLMRAIRERLDTNKLRNPDLTAEEIAYREQVQQRVSDMILDATMPKTDRVPVRYAVDESGIPTWARGSRKAKLGEIIKIIAEHDEEIAALRAKKGLGVNVDKELAGLEAATSAAIAELAGENGANLPSDLDAAWGYQTLTFDKATQFVFGYQLVAFNRIGEIPVIERIHLATASTSGAPEAMSLLTDWQAKRRAAGQPAIQTLLSDRGFTNSIAENWARPLRDMGIEQVLDINPLDHGARGYDDKVLMIDGKPHHIATPEHLHYIERPAILAIKDPGDDATIDKKMLYKKQKAELEQFQALIAERRAYQLRRVEGPDRSGKERWEFPCCAGTIRDPNCPMSMALPEELPLVTYPAHIKPPKHARTFTLKGDVQEKLRQRLTWGSPEWIAEYSKRASIEGQFGNLKNTSTERVKRGWIRITGRVATFLILTLAIAQSNLRQLQAWANRNKDYSDPRTPPPGAQPQFEELDKNGNIFFAATAPAQAPPGI